MYPSVYLTVPLLAASFAAGRPRAIPSSSNRFVQEQEEHSEPSSLTQWIREPATIHLPSSLADVSTFITTGRLPGRSRRMQEQSSQREKSEKQQQQQKQQQKDVQSLQFDLHDPAREVVLQPEIFIPYDHDDDYENNDIPATYTTFPDESPAYILDVLPSQQDNKIVENTKSTHFEFIWPMAHNRDRMVSDFGPMTTMTLSAGPKLSTGKMHGIISMVLEQIFESYDPRSPLPRKLWLHSSNLGAMLRLDFSHDQEATTTTLDHSQYRLTYGDLIRFLIALDEVIPLEDDINSTEIPSFQGVVKPLARLDQVIGRFTLEPWQAHQKVADQGMTSPTTGSSWVSEKTIIGAEL